MPRYIDADMLETVVYELNYQRAEKWGITRGEFKIIDSVLFEFPTADVVEVVRCKDCKYQSKGQNECETWNLCGYRPWQYTPTTDEHFCSYAERRTDEAD